MTDLDFESGQLQLVTDALRAGPGTPQWRAALEALEAGGGGGAGALGGDEYNRLYAARERLASGRRYREVRAGAGFTRKVFDAIDEEESASPRGVPSANLVAAVSALTILGILAVIAYLVVPRDATQPPAKNLAETYFVTPVAQSGFETELGSDWTAFGALALEAKAGLRPVLRDLPSESRGGGAVSQRTLAPEQPFAVEATVRVPRADANLAVQVFVGDDPNFTGDSATSDRELLFNAVAGEASVVLPGGRIETQGARLALRAPLAVRVTINRAEAAVELNGKKLWSGPNPLDPTKPRLAGVRFLARSAAGPATAPAADRDRPVVESIRVLVPQKQ